MITVGSRVGGFTVLHLLGQGGMGQVYLAQHHRIARRAAIKVLLPELSANESVVERFFTEARATSLIRHPGIVEVLDCDVRDGQAFIVMEHLEGESLADYLERIGSLAGDTAFALAVLGQVALAVGAAHATGIVHRDLKPDNIFLSVSAVEQRVVPKVLDFGIAKLADRGLATHTRTGAVLGTPTYMSPEQCRGGSKVVDGRSDIYSLGCILYEALCGVPPFVRDGMGDLIVAHVSEAPEPPRARAPATPLAVDRLVMHMLAKAPADRPPTMDAVAQEMADCLVALGMHIALADVRPRTPVIVPFLPAHFPAVSPSEPGVGGAAPTPTPPGNVIAPSRATTPFSASSGGTQVLPEVMSDVLSDDKPPRQHASSLDRPSTTLRSAIGERTPPAVPNVARRSPFGRAMIMLVVAVGIGGAGALVALRGRIFASTTNPVPDPPSAPAEPRPPASTAAAAAVAPATITVGLQGLPPGAEVLVDGVAAPGLPLQLVREDRRHRLLVRAPGYEPRTIEVDASRDRVVNLELTASTAMANLGQPPRTQATAVAAPRSTRLREDKARARELRRRGDGTSPGRRPTAAASPSRGDDLPAPNEIPSKPSPPKPTRSSYDDM